MSIPMKFSAPPNGTAVIRRNHSTPPILIRRPPIPTPAVCRRETDITTKFVVYESSMEKGIIRNGLIRRGEHVDCPF